MKLREGNVFTSVCHSVDRAGMPGPRSLLGVGMPGLRSLLGGSWYTGGYQEGVGIPEVYQVYPAP